MGDTLEGLIVRAIFMKRGNTDFALFYADGQWEAQIGNPSNCVGLGEIVGDFVADGRTATEAVQGLIAQLQSTDG